MIKKSVLFVIFVSAICISELTLAKSGRPFSAKIEFPFRVVDDSGKPVYQANVDGYFWCPYTSNAAGDAFNEDTDTNGYCIIKGRGYAYIEGEVTKPGYYKTHYKISLGNVNQARKTKKWSLEKAKVVLREKKNPISMYAKRVDTKIPVTGKCCGYDLMAGDWVAPYGKGKVEDFIFMINGWWKDYRNNDSYLTLSFLHTSDGIMAVKPVVPSSEFRMQRYAPGNGYKNQIKWHMKRTQKPGYQNDEIIDEVNIKERGYIFRIRSQTNEYGVVTNALYGKVSSNFGFAGAAEKGGSWLRFTYYLNPTPNDRNMEFDPKKNLFKNLKSFEYPICP